MPDLLRRFVPWILIAGVLVNCQQKTSSMSDTEMHQKAEELAQKYIIVDTHIDAPYQQAKDSIDITRKSDRHFDYPKAVAGGLNVPFMSIYISPKFQENGAKQEAEYLIGLVEEWANDYPEKFAIATSPEMVRKQFVQGVISLVMGMENGAPIEGSFENLRYFYDRGIRYITLTHSKSNHISDSSYDSTRVWNGLSPFGKKLIPGMNQAGMMIDVSHISDTAFYQVMELTRAPVIASHSSCRFYTPGFERNMNDEMIKMVAEGGGVIQVNFGSYFVKDGFRQKWAAMEKAVKQYRDDHNLQRDDAEVKGFIARYKDEHNIQDADITHVVQHIEHIVELVGIDYVGIGSDYDGVGSVPTGLENVSKYPNLIYELLKRGYSDEDIEKICSENLLRVWENVNAVASSMSAQSG